MLRVICHLNRFKTILKGLGASLVVLLSGFVRSEEVLSLLVWEAYISPSVIEAFEAQTGIRVEINFFRNDPQRSLLISASPEAYDLTLLDRADLSHYRDLKWIAPMNLTLIPNRQHLDAQWIDSQELGLAYTWGTTGIAYRADKLEAAPSKWSDLLDPSPALRGKLSMINEAEEIFISTLKYMGLEMKELSLQTIDLAYDILSTQRPYVRYSNEPLDRHNGFVTGELLAGMAYSGDAAFLNRHFNSNIHYVLPAEGCILWADYWVILAKSPNRENAHKFLDFINTPKYARDNIQFISNATTNKAAYQLLSEEEKNNPTIYPSQKALEHCEFISTKTSAVSRELNHSFFMLSGSR